MINQCNFIGRLGADPESKYSQQGTQIVNFNLACTEKYKGEERTEWVRIVMFGKVAEIAANYLQKGSLCFVSGRLQTRQWEDQQGNKRYTTEIVGNTLKLLSPNGNNSDNSCPEPPSGGGPGMGDDVPFMYTI